MHVPLDDVLLAGFHVNALKVASQEYAAALTGGHRLNYKSLGLLLRKLVLEITLLVGQDPGLREEVIVLSKLLLHSFQITGKIILVRQALHAWVVIDSLIRLHLLYSEGLDACVRPVQIPIRILIIIQLIIQLPARFLNNSILGLRGTQHQLRRQLLLLLALLLLVLRRLIDILHFLSIKHSQLSSVLLDLLHDDLVRIVSYQHVLLLGFPFLVDLLLLASLPTALAILALYPLALSLGRRTLRLSCRVGQIVGRAKVRVGGWRLLLPLRRRTLRLTATITLRRTGTRIQGSRGIVAHLSLNLLENGYLTHVFC